MGSVFYQADLDFLGSRKKYGKSSYLRLHSFLITHVGATHLLVETYQGSHKLWNFLTLKFGATQEKNFFQSTWLQHEKGQLYGHEAYAFES